MAKTLDQIADMARRYFAARDEFRAHHGTKPKDYDLDNEDHIRWHIQNEKLIGLSVKHEMAYRAACDEFFSQRTGDLIEFRDGLSEHLDGGPNEAMRLMQDVNSLLGAAS